MANLNYLRALSEEEALEYQRKAFEKIQPGALFDLGCRRWFIAVQKLNKDCWSVLELDKKNIQNLIKEKPAIRSVISFDQMECLNVHKPLNK